MPAELKDARIIAISGKQYAGKDFLADLLLKHFPDFEKTPLAAAIKQEYGNQHGLTVEEIEADKATHRPGLIAMGDWGRSQDPDFWLKKVKEWPGKIIIPDVRLKREYDALKDWDAYLIRLHADRDVRSRRGTIVSEGDPTETQLDDIDEWNLTLINNGAPEDLQAQLNLYL